MALCSESTGRIETPRAAARARRSSPARTSDSLLASPTVLPASMAAAVERSPAPPEIRGEDKIHVRVGGQGAHPGVPFQHLDTARGRLPHLPRRLPISHRHKARPVTEHLLRQESRVPAGREPDDLEPFGVAGRHVQGLYADGAGGAQDRQPFHRLISSRNLAQIQPAGALAPPYPAKSDAHR